MRGISMAIAAILCSNTNGLDIQTLQGIRSGQEAEAALSMNADEAQDLADKRAAHERMKNKAIKSLEQMLALDDSNGDIFAQQT